MSLRDAIRDYVVNGIEKEKETICRLAAGNWKFLEKDKTVYRGQPCEYDDPSKMCLFSVSTDKTVAKEQFGECVWTITLKKGTRYLDVNDVYPENKKDDEYEFLIKGGGIMKDVRKIGNEYSATYTNAVIINRPLSPDIEKAITMANMFKGRGRRKKRATRKLRRRRRF